MMLLPCLAWQISEEAYNGLGGMADEFEERDTINVKGKGMMKTYLLKEEVARALAPALAE